MTSNKVTQEGCKTLLDEVTEKEEAGKRLEEHFQGLINAIKKKGCDAKTGLKEGRLQIRKDYNKLLEKYRSIHVESEQDIGFTKKLQTDLNDERRKQKLANAEMTIIDLVLYNENGVVCLSYIFIALRRIQF